MEVIDFLKEDCERVFPLVVEGLALQTDLTHELPRFRIGFIRDNRIKARIGYMPGRSKTVLITVSEFLLIDIYQLIENHKKIISSMMKIGVSKTFIDERFDALVKEAIYDIALQFVLHHELFHLLSGHFDYQRKNFGLGQIDEYYGFADMGNKPNGNDSLHFYFQEMEADNSSLIWIINKLALEQVNLVLISLNLVEDNFKEEIVLLTEGAKDFAYKMVFIAFWMVVSLIESYRLNVIKSTTEEHPFPVARIITCIHTLMEHYAKLIISRKSTGGNFVKLTNSNISYIERFIESIVLPFCTFFRDFPDASIADNELFTANDFDLSNKVISIIKDSNNLLANRSPKNVGGLQIDDIEIVRREMEIKLNSYRYLKEIIL